jgi:hypothetical protein
MVLDLSMRKAYASLSDTDSRFGVYLFGADTLSSMPPGSRLGRRCERNWKTPPFGCSRTLQPKRRRRHTIMTTAVTGVRMVEYPYSCLRALRLRNGLQRGEVICPIDRRIDDPLFVGGDKLCVHHNAGEAFPSANGCSSTMRNIMNTERLRGVCNALEEFKSAFQGSSNGIRCNKHRGVCATISRLELSRPIVRSCGHDERMA